MTFSVDPSKGKIRLYVDNDADGDFLDADEVSPVFTAQTINVSNGGTSPAGSLLKGSLGVGIYHNMSVYRDTTMDVNNVQVVGG